MAIRMRYGLESEFDPDKMVVGEWAVSTDMKYVRMCFAPGIVARMATYEAFEADMVKVKELVSNAQSVKDIVIGLASEVGSKTTIVLEATEEAKKYMEEAKKYSELAFATTPEGYEVLVRDVNLLKNSIIHTTDRTLYGSKAGGIKLIGVKGASEQAVYSGKNLFDTSALTESTINGVTFTPVYNNGLLEHVNVNGTASELAEFHFGNFTCETDTILTGCPSGGSNSTYSLRASGVGGDTGSGMSLPTNKTVGIYIQIRSGITINNLKFYPMIRLATIEDDTYEPFVGNAPSPSPSYPQEIESVGDSGSLVIEQEGKNLLNSTLQTTTLNGVTCTNNGDGTYTLSGTATAHTAFPVGYVPVTGNEMRAVGCPIGGSLETYCLKMQFASTPTGGEKGVSNDTGSGTLSIASMDGANYIRILLYVNSGATINNVVFKPMLLNADLFPNVTYEDYEPYHSNTITIPLSEPLRGIGDIKDEVVCKDGVWGVLRKIGSRVFDGSENWQASSTNASGIHRRRYEGWTTSAPKGSTANTAIANVLCDSYIPNSANATYSRIQGVSIDTVGALDIYDENYNTSNLSSWKAWLAENPITVEYELATPVFEPFTDQTPFYGMQSYDTVTYISTDSKVEPSIEVKYARTEGDAITLGNYNRTKLNEIHIGELMALQTELAAALVAGSEV